MKARKPGPFCLDTGRPIVWCIPVDGSRGSRYVYTSQAASVRCLGPIDATRLAAWLTKAAAWCREDGK